MANANLEIAKEYVALFDDPAAEPDQIKSFYSPDVVYEEMPNLLAPMGSKRGRVEMLAGTAQAKDLLIEQNYWVQRAISEGDEVVLEVEWRASWLLDLAMLLRARIAMFITFAAGKIAHQRDYDAYTPIA